MLLFSSILLVSSTCFSLKKGGHIYYLGQDNLALLGLIDASECPPTYGASKTLTFWKTHIMNMSI